MKIYTKTGDKGTTLLIGGKRVPKYHLRIEAYGSIDELMAYISMIRDQDIAPEIQATLLKVLDRLMTCAAILAADCEDCKVRIPELKDSDIQFLETEIDTMDAGLAPLHSFILPGGHTIVSFCHIARTVCRRAERQVVLLSKDLNVPENVERYINRLSDYLFVLSRRLGKDLNVKEIHWVPKL